MPALENMFSSARSSIEPRADHCASPTLRIDNAQDAVEALWLVHCGLLKPPSPALTLRGEQGKKVASGSLLVWKSSNPSGLDEDLDCGLLWSPPSERNGLDAYTDAQDERLHRLQLDAYISHSPENGREYWHMATYVNTDPCQPPLPSLCDDFDFAACVAKMPRDFFTVLPPSTRTYPSSPGRSHIPPLRSLRTDSPVSPERAMPSYRSLRFSAIGSGPRSVLKRSQSVASFASERGSQTLFPRLKRRSRASLPLLPSTPSPSPAPEVTHLETDPRDFLFGLSDTPTSIRISALSDLVVQSSEFRASLKSLVPASAVGNRTPRNLIISDYIAKLSHLLHVVSTSATQSDPSIIPTSMLTGVAGRGPTFAGFLVGESRSAHWSAGAFFLCARPVIPDPSLQRRNTGDDDDFSLDSDAGQAGDARGWEAFGPLSRAQLAGRNAKMMGWIASCMMTQTGGRRSVLGIDIQGCDAQLWYFDRAGSVHSSSMDISKQPQHFVATYLALLTATPDALGCEPSLEPPDSGASLFGTVEGHTIRTGSHSFTLGDPIHITPSPFGRSTSVYAAHHRDTSPSDARKVHGIPDRVIVKLSWQTIDQSLEDELFRRVEQEGIEGVARLFFSMSLGRLSDTFRRHICAPGTFVDRELRVQIMGPVCVPLYSISDAAVFKQAFRSLIRAHHDLYERGGILHRDISINNLMVTADDPSIGVLIDLDLAVSVRGHGVHRHIPASRTGTLPFLSCEFLLRKLPPRHLYRHDLESFFFVLAWILWRYRAGQSLHTTMWNEWYQGTLPQMSLSKQGVFLNTDYFPVAQFPDIWEFWFQPWGRAFYRGYGEMIDDGADSETLGNHITFDKILTILEQ